ncbi:MAG: hypothetical protein R3332_04460 [Pseudohongiellaceae bacterium]|nr:hypothetical protein [Pseudohongiellaceae bacterium]
MSNTPLSLPNFDLVRISGAEAAQFLQGQLSCNVVKLEDTQWVPGVYCEVNGRILSDFSLFKHEEQFYLLSQHGTGETLRSELAKYAAFSKADVTLISHEFTRIGFTNFDALQQWCTSHASLPSTMDAQNNFSPIKDGFVLRLQGQPTRYEVLIKSNSALDVDDSQQESWTLADIRAGLMHIAPEQMSQHTPQVLNYDLYGAIDFKKGCYRGQEIVARMHYKGTAKKRLFHVVFEGDIPSEGDKITLADKSIGEIVKLAHSGASTSEALAVLNSTALDLPVAELGVESQEGKTSTKVLSVRNFDYKN